jgi:hypothetical protein
MSVTCLPTRKASDCGFIAPPLQTSRAVSNHLRRVCVSPYAAAYAPLRGAVLRGGWFGRYDGEGVAEDDLIIGLAIKTDAAGSDVEAVEMRDGAMGSGGIGEIVIGQAYPITDMEARRCHGRYLSIAGQEQQNARPWIAPETRVETTLPARPSPESGAQTNAASQSQGRRRVSCRAWSTYP